MDSHTILVVFYRPPADDWFINRAVAAVNPPYSHVEIGFVADQYHNNFLQSQECDSVTASSIMSGSNVFLRNRSFRNPAYDVLAINVSKKAHDDMLRFCRLQERASVCFDELGMWLAILPFKVRSLPVGKTFCSAYVTTVLQRGGVQCVRGLLPESTSPSRLWRKLQSCNTQCFSVIPSRMQNMRERESLFRTVPV